MNMQEVIIYFENGILTQISPSSECNQYEARYLVTDGSVFDLENDLDIINIPIPTFKGIHGFPDISHSLDYVLKRNASYLKIKGLFNAFIVCLRKVNQLMSQSPIRWKKRDYFDIVFELARAGKFEEAKKEKAFIEDNYFIKYDFSAIHKIALQKELEAIQQLKTDLVESDAAPNCNELCAKYRKRIYSMSGKDKRFPAMTCEIYNSGLLFYPFIEGVSRPQYCTLDNIIEYNNRPFVDERSNEEKENHEHFMKQRILEDRKAVDFLEYCQICKYIPLLKPKSFKLYQEMKYHNTEDFQELMQVAEESRIDIEF